MHLNEARREFGDSFSYVTKEYDADRVDLAIDDDYMCKSWLPADQVVMVYDLPDTEDLLEEKFGHLFE